MCQGSMDDIDFTGLELHLNTAQYRHGLITGPAS
jgi:hypothetical protein